MNATECEQLEALINMLQGNYPVTRAERAAAVKFLRQYQYLAARVAGEWQKAKELEAQYGIR